MHVVHCPVIVVASTTKQSQHDGATTTIAPSNEKKRRTQRMKWNTEPNKMHIHTYNVYTMHDKRELRATRYENYRPWPRPIFTPTQNYSSVFSRASTCINVFSRSPSPDQCYAWQEQREQRFSLGTHSESAFTALRSSTCSLTLSAVVVTQQFTNGEIHIWWHCIFICA